MVAKLIGDAERAVGKAVTALSAGERVGRIVGAPQIRELSAQAEPLEQARLGLQARPVLEPAQRADLRSIAAELIAEREAARKAKDFKRSDELRKALLEKGVSIEDTPKGTKWKLTRG